MDTGSIIILVVIAGLVIIWTAYLSGRKKSAPASRPAGTAAAAAKPKVYPEICPYCETINEMRQARCPACGSSFE